MYSQITIQNSADNRLRLFTTSDKRRFQITSWPSMGAIAEQYAYIRGARFMPLHSFILTRRLRKDEFFLTCPSAPPGPDGRPNFYPCGTRQAGYQCQAQNFANIWGMPPVQESTPFFPTPKCVLRALLVGALISRAATRRSIAPSLALTRSLRPL